MFQNILVAIDGSPDADQALTQAIDLAESEHTRLTLFSAVVTPPAVAYAGVSGETVEQLWRDAEAETGTLLRAAADTWDDYLAAVAFDLVIGQCHMRVVRREHTPRMPAP